MECSLPATTAFNIKTLSTKSTASPTTMSKPKPASNHKESAPKSLTLHVNFDSDKGELERKKKYLTAKYGQHQMNLIKKRLRVEMWMYEQLQTLYEIAEELDNDIEIDLDELLDLDEETLRKEWLRNKLSDAKKSQENIETFIEELLERAKTL